MTVAWRPVHSVEAGLFVRESGPEGAKPPLVWIHGLGESGLCFEGIVAHPRLAAFRHLIPDLPGYGRSAWPSEPETLEAAADHLTAWLSGRGDAPAIIVGHSLGGYLGQLLAERHPAGVAALVNVEGNISAEDCTVSAQAAEQALEDFASAGLEKMADWVYRAGASDRALRGAYASLRLCDPRTFHLHARQLVEASREEALASRLARLPMPVVYLAARPGGVAQRSLGLLAESNVETVLIQPSGHWPFIDQPDLFAAALRGGLGRAGIEARP